MANSLAVIGVGFLLGVRHATDADHVIAVTTIVSRQKSFRHAGLIGALWGVGHTITIFFVGVAIILFDLAIPPRIGLAMELAVGLMLILLGVLNLTGVTQWITHRFTPVHNSIAAGIPHNEHVYRPIPDLHTHLDQKTKGLFQNPLQRLGRISFSARSLLDLCTDSPDRRPSLRLS